MKIAILGTRGIPNRYGGFEQCAEYLAEGLTKKGHEITVYNSHIHPYKENSWKGTKIIHCKNPEDRLGTAGLFIYDLNCILDARKRGYDIILMLGYTSSSVWGRFFPRKRTVVTTNMDGLEWKRTKFSEPVRKFLKYAESLGVKFSDHLIADSLGIQSYLKEKYNASSIYIPYGAFIFENPNINILKEYSLNIYNYNMLIARLEPENSIDIILEGVSKSSSDQPFLVIGKHEGAYGEYLKNKYRSFNNIKFVGAIYDISVLNNLRYYSNIYFHGHTVGGTNPSLLEAMASSALICANKNSFNETILGDDASYFSVAEDVTIAINNLKKNQYSNAINNNLNKITDIYKWDLIIDQYEDHFKSICKPSIN